MGIALYFAAQGAGRLQWPLLAGALRLFLYAGLGWATLVVTGSLSAFFALGALAMSVYGLLILWSVASGQWFAKARRSAP
ncbi:hypothetical protein D3C71_1980710 [compost metagenome]